MVRTCFLMASVILLGFSIQVAAQTSAPVVKQEINPVVSKAPSMSSKATTVAPVAPGSSEMHVVETPKVQDRTTMTGGNTNGGAN